MITEIGKKRIKIKIDKEDFNKFFMAKKLHGKFAYLNKV